MTSSQTPDPDPQPRRTPGLEPGRGVPPGETPPPESGMSETGPQDTVYNPPKGWAKAPMALIIGLTLVIAAFFLVYAIILLL
ncbi:MULTISPECIES: DUF6480 family protein [unclassified Streptomyces]|uniref:DUF6480 family protein n=1 Tax=unclassified Streptomyces TaxID=2593676 RepID=UPI000476B905|nr:MULTISPECIES: DUF6480 family protein [unclassified Streptomyces]MYY06889.1 hypothetical protein [Streptomyces sp. SID4913]